MEVFISWSGKQSQEVADALHRYLPQMINAVEPWVSSADIEAGARWGADIAGKLEKSKVGIICLTPSNLDAIWIHFEAGALAKTLENTFVCPYLCDVKPSHVKGPLAQFQAMRADEQGTRRLLETLNRALGENARKPEDLAEAFNVWWPKLKEKLDAIQNEGPPAKARSAEDMLEEILSLVRSQAQIPPTALTYEKVTGLMNEILPGKEFSLTRRPSQRLRLLDDASVPLILDLDERFGESTLRALLENVKIRAAHPASHHEIPPE